MKKFIDGYTYIAIGIMALISSMLGLITRDKIHPINYMILALLILIEGIGKVMNYKLKSSEKLRKSR